MVQYLESCGHSCTLYFYNPDTVVSLDEQVGFVRKGYAPVNAAILRLSDGIRDADALIATMWPTAYPLFNDRSPAQRFYFVQDFEPSFYPTSTESVLAENTYRFGFHGITAGRWLSEKLTAEFGMRCDHFDFGVDTATYVNLSRQHRRGVAFYARPETPRRGFELGAMALLLFHKRHPDVDIHLIGRSGHVRLPFPCVNHGVLSPAELNDVYSHCSAGLVISLTNMSLLPLELLASGCIPVVNDGDNTRKVLDNPHVHFAQPSPHALADALSRAVAHPDATARSKLASASVAGTSWMEAGARVERIIMQTVRGKVA